jgi:hypothetical protein
MFIICSFLLLPVTAIDESPPVLLIVRPNVDPRVVASQSSIRVEFRNKDNDDIYFVNLMHYNEYCAKVYVSKGEYIMISGDVSNDYKGEYPIQGVSFFARGVSTEVNFDVGDPNYKAPVTTNNNALIGDIDHKQTNSLLSEDNKPTINWSQLDENMDPYNTDPNNPYLGIGNVSETPNKPVTEITTDTVSHTTEVGNTETTNIVENTTSDITDDERSPQQKKFSTVITLIVIIGVVGVVLYFRYKNADVFVLEEDEEI